MARSSNGPWFRASKNTWFVCHDGKQISLGVKGEGNRQEAQRAWHRLMAEVPTEKPKTVEPKPKAPEPSVSVRQLADAFLADVQGRISPEAWRGYRKFLTPFADAFGDRQVESMTAQDAEAFSKKPEWSATYCAGFLGTVSTMYRWAIRQRYIALNPMESIRKPVRQSRGTKAVLTPEEHAKIIAHATPFMRDYLAILWGTGARPGEVSGLTAEMVRGSTDGVIPLAAHKTAHHGKARFLILTGDALAIAQRKADEVGEGLLFSGVHGRLTAQAIGCRLRKLCRKAGVRHLIPYGYRHTYATQALAAGIPDAHVAALLGHSGTAMLHKHYSHLTGQSQVLRDAALRVRG